MGRGNTDMTWTIFTPPEGFGRSYLYNDVLKPFTNTPARTVEVSRSLYELLDLVETFRLRINVE